VADPDLRPPDDEEIRLVGRVSAVQVAAGVTVGAALVAAGVATGDQDWFEALSLGLVAGAGGGLVVALGGGPVQRGMDRVERVVPAGALCSAPERTRWVWTAVVYAAIAAWLGVVRAEYAFAGTMAIVGSLLYAAEGRTIRSWERERGGRLGSVSRPSRRRRPFRTPEYVLVVDDPRRADAQAASSSSVALSGAPSK
jgi:hypothetical protein